MASITKIKNKTGTKYKVRIRVKNQPTITKTFSSKISASEWGKRTEIFIKDNPGKAYSLSKKYTLNQIIDKYIKEILPEKPKSQKLRTQQLTWWKKEIGHLLISNITTPIVYEARQVMREEISSGGRKRKNSTVNNYTTSLGSVFSTAIKEWEYTELNPVLNLRKLTGSVPRTRFLTKTELKIFLAECKNSSSKYLYPIVVMLLSTGSRKMEIVGLKWSDLNLEHGSGIIHETKNKEKKSLIIEGEVKNLIQKLYKKRKNKIWVFPNKIGDGACNVYVAFKEALKRAEIKDFRIHDLRHTAASYLAQEGVSIREIADILGHKTLQMTMRYSHLLKSTKKKNIQILNNKIFPGDSNE
ncbi:MAG: tyrosine-type recombinase/integrase [Alphaproteobacteria bacterium]